MRHSLSVPLPNPHQQQQQDQQPAAQQRNLLMSGSVTCSFAEKLRTILSLESGRSLPLICAMRERTPNTLEVGFVTLFHRQEFLCLERAPSSGLITLFVYRQGDGLDFEPGWVKVSCGKEEDIVAHIRDYISK